MSISFNTKKEAEEYKKQKEEEGFSTDIKREGRKFVVYLYHDRNINSKLRAIADVDMIHKEAQKQVGSYAVMGDDIDEYNKAMKKISEYPTGKDAYTGDEIEIDNVTRVGGKGRFYSDIPNREFSKDINKVEIRNIHFKNPVVFKDQWEAVSDLIGTGMSNDLKYEYNEIKKEENLGKLSSLNDFTKSKRITDFWVKVDNMIIDKVKEKGYDGIIYHHGRRDASSEYVVL